MTDVLAPFPCTTTKIRTTFCLHVGGVYHANDQKCSIIQIFRNEMPLLFINFYAFKVKDKEAWV